VAGISLKYFIIPDIRLVPKNEKIPDQRYHSDHSVDQDVERHADEGDSWQSMLHAAVQQSRRHQRCCLITEDWYESDDRLEPEANSGSGNQKNRIEQTTNKFNERIRAGVATRLTPARQNFYFDIF